MAQWLILFNAGTLGITVLCIAILLGKKSRIHPLNYLLAGFLGCYAIHHLSYFHLLDPDFVDVLNVMFRWPYPVMMLVGPLFYLFFRNVLESTRLKPRDLLFALPSLVVLVDQAPIYALPAESKHEILMAIAMDPGANLPSVEGWILPGDWLLLIRYLYNVPFVVAAFRLYMTHRSVLQDLAKASRSDHWYGWLLIPIVLFMVSVALNPGMLMLLTNRIFEFGWFDLMDGLRINVAMGSAMLLYVCSLILFNPEILFITNANRLSQQIDQTKMKEIMTAIDKLYGQDPLYLESSLRLSDVAARLQVDAITLSQSLNTVRGVNFNQHVNRWRVEHAKRRMAAGDHETLTIETIAKASGFASRSSFYNAFKAVEGMTPRAYIRHSKESLETGEGV